MMPRQLLRALVPWVALVCGVAAGAWPIAFLKPASAAPEKPPGRWTLPVTLHAQETQVWCWAATGQMTMEFLGKPISQGEQANHVLGRNDCGRHPCPPECVKGGSVVLSPFGFTFESSSKPLSEVEL